MKMRSNFLNVAFIVSLLLLVGCGQNLKEIEGDYKGSITTIRVDEVTTFQIESAVKATNNSLEITIQNAETNEELYIFSVKKKNKNLLLSSSMFQQNETVELETNGACASTSSNARLKVSSCLTSTSLLFNIVDIEQNFKLILIATKEDETLDGHSIESREYTLAELVELANRYNLENILQAQSVYQGREEILLNRGRLFPSFNMGTIIAGVDFPFGLTSEVGNLLPFLFPNNWYRLSKSETLFEAERLSYAALKANQVSLVEGLYYTILRDQGYQKSLDGHLERLMNLKNIMDRQFEMGIGTESPARYIQLKISDITTDIISIEDFLVNQNTSIMRSIGASPSKGTLQLAQVTLPNLNKATEIDLRGAENQAIAVSFERQTALQLELASQFQVGEATWSWLNPNSDPSFNIGLGWEHAIKIEELNGRQAQINRRIIENKIRQELQSIESRLHLIFAQYVVDLEGLQSAEALLSFETERFQNGDDVKAIELLDLSETILKFNVKLTALQYSYLITMGKLDRLLLEGFYDADTMLKLADALPEARERTNKLLNKQK